MLQRRVGKLRNEFFQTVLINDTVPDSQYFRVDDLPQELTAGKNMFKMYGDNTLLVPSSDILIQVTDINGQPIYHHVNNFVDASGRILVGIWIYPETPPGLGRIEIIGKATRRPQGNFVPHTWTNKFNVKWSRDIIIAPHKPNKTPIVFKQIPGVSITENVREYLTQTYLTGTSIGVQSVGEISYNYSGYGNAYVTITGAQFSASMAGGLLTVPDPNVTLPVGYVLQTGASTEYTAYVDSVVNNTTLQVSPHTLAVQSTNTVSNINNDGRSNVSTVASTLPVTSFGPIANYTMSWQQDATYATGSTNSQSFASITIKNMDPMVGKVHSVKTHMKSHGYADFQLVGEEIIQERDLLINVDSDLAFDRVGDFKSQEIINEYWESGSENQTINFVNKHSDEQMISSLIVTGSDLLNGSTNYPDPPSNIDPYIFVKNKTGIDIYQDNEYQIKFKIVAEAYPGQVSSSYMDIYISGSNIGASDGRNIGTKLITLESTNVAPGFVTNVNQFNNIASNQYAAYSTGRTNNTSQNLTLPASFNSNTQTAINISDIPPIDERLLELTYTPSLDTTAHVVFVITRGKWHIADVSVEGANDYGFTPNHTFLEIPIQTPQADDILDFKFEFFNTDGDIANITLTTQSMDFVGSNLYISGNDNFMSGSINIGNGIMMQGFTSDRN